MAHASSVALGVETRRGARVAPSLEPAELRDWGWLPVVSLIVAIGLLLLAFTYNGARAEAEWAGTMLWASLLVLFLPIAARLIGTGATRHERIGLVGLLGVALYLIKVLYSPIRFDFPDEMQHWRTANDIIRGGHLFEQNPMLPVSAYYPGLENVTTALASASGLTIFWSGVVVVGATRLLFMVALFLFYEQVSHSPRTAGIAVMLYATNPNFVYFDGQFAYESLALPIAALALFAAARRGHPLDGSGVGLSLAILLGIGTVVITHHFTAYMLAAFFVVWTAAALLIATVPRLLDAGHRWRMVGIGPSMISGTTAFSCVAAMAWLSYVATLAVGYLGPNFLAGIVELIDMIAGETAGRTLFRDGSGQQAALFDQAMGYGSVALVLLGLPFGVQQVWRHHRTNAAILALTVVALAYPATLPLRLTPKGVATAGRLPEFLYFGTAFVLALVVVRAWPSAQRVRLRAVALVGCAAVAFLGGVIVGWGPPRRLPGGYLVSADSRSVEPQGIASAEWARSVLRSGHPIATDRTNTLLMGSYGEQRTITVTADRMNVSPVFFAPELGAYERSLLQAANVRYVLIDRRLSTALPVSGVYYDNLEPGNFEHRTPIDPAALAKFDRSRDVSRVFDSGDIAIYDVGDLRSAP